MDDKAGSHQTDEETEVVQPLAYVLAAPLPEQDETYTQQTVPTVVKGCVCDD